MSSVFVLGLTRIFPTILGVAIMSAAASIFHNAVTPKF